MSTGVIVRQAALGEVCAGAPKSVLCSALERSIGRFEPALLASTAKFPLLKGIKGAILTTKPLESGECRVKGLVRQSPIRAVRDLTVQETRGISAGRSQT
jgi:hypothetical protein